MSLTPTISNPEDRIYTFDLHLTGSEDSIRAALVEVDPAASGILSAENLLEVFRLTLGPANALTKHQVISIHRHLAKEGPDAAVTATAVLQLFESKG